MFKTILSLAVLTCLLAPQSLSAQSLSAQSLSAQRPKQLTIEQASRKFQIQAYQLFRHNRAEYSRRLLAADTLLEIWDAAGQPQNRSDEVVGWFNQSGRMTLVDANFPENPNLPKKPSRAKQSHKKAQADYKVEIFQEGQEEQVSQFGQKKNTDNDPTTAPHIPNLPRIKVDPQGNSDNPFVDDPPNFLKSTKPVIVNLESSEKPVKDDEKTDDSKSNTNASESGFLNPTKFLRGLDWSKLRGSGK